MQYLDRGFYKESDKDTSKVFCEWDVLDDEIDGVMRTTEARIQLNYIIGKRVLFSGEYQSMRATYETGVNQMANFVEVVDNFVSIIVDDFNLDGNEKLAITSAARAWAYANLREI